MKRIDYYNTNDEISWIASKVFTDEHYGRAITREEYQQRLKLEEEYKDEIELAKLMIKNNPQVSELSYKDQINLSANLIMELREKKENNNRKK